MFHIFLISAITIYGQISRYIVIKNIKLQTDFYILFFNYLNVNNTLRLKMFCDKLRWHGYCIVKIIFAKQDQP